MGLTVARASQMEIFKKCKVLTGEVGLQNEVLWVNILEILDDLSHIEPGEFLITTAHNLNRQSEKELETMIEFFTEMKLAAIAIQTGHYLQKIPTFLVRCSKAHGIPLLEIPPEISFKTLTRALMTELIKDGRTTIPERKKIRDENHETEISEMKSVWQKMVEHQSPDSFLLELKKFSIRSQGPFLISALVLKQVTDNVLSEGNAFPDNLSGLIEHSLVQIFQQLSIPILIGSSKTYQLFLLQTQSIKSQEIDSAQKVALSLLSRLNKFFPGWKFQIATSAVHENLEAFRLALEETEKTLQATRLGLTGSQEVATYGRLGLYSLIMEINNMEMLKQLFEQTTAPLIRHDYSGRGDLVKTLQSYLQHCSIRKAAEEIFVHRHTMKYRLEQIEKLTGLNPLESADALQLNLGLHVYHYLAAAGLLN
jgi:hypothetical protein